MSRILKRENRIGRAREHLWVVCLNKKKTIVLIELTGLGNSKAVPVEPADVFSLAIHKNAASIVLVHNHPSGILKPSFSDTELTEKMLAIGKFLSIPVMDSMMISETGYYSFSESGILMKLKRNSKIDLSFKNVEELREKLRESDQSIQSLNIRLAKVTKESQKQLKEAAKRLLKKGMSREETAAILGVALEQVEKIR